MVPLTLGAIRLCLDAAAGSRAAQAYLTTRVSQFFTVDTYNVEGKDPLVVRFLGEDNLCWKDRDRKKTLPIST